MAKLSRNEKIELYTKRLNGESLVNLSSIYGIGLSNVKYLVRLIHMHGFDILRKDKNRYYSPEYKIAAINRVLVNYESVGSVSLDIGLSSSGMLINWIRKYKENGYNIIEKKRGRLPMKKTKIINHENVTPEEKISELKKRLEYVEAENEYLKKLKIIVDTRVEHEKKKKQK